MRNKMNTAGWIVAIAGIVLVAATAWVVRTSPYSEQKNSVAYIMKHSCTKTALDLGMDKAFTAYPDSPRFKYTCDNGQVFWSNK